MIFHILIIFWSNSQKKKKKNQWKTVLKLELLAKYWYNLSFSKFIHVKEPKKKDKNKKNNDARFLAKYTLSSVRQAN